MTNRDQSSREAYSDRVLKVREIKAQIIEAACKKENASVFHQSAFARALWEAANK